MNTKLKAAIIIVVCTALLVAGVWGASILITGTVTVQTPASIGIDNPSLDFGTLAPNGETTLTRTLTNNGGSSTSQLSMNSTLPAAVGTLAWDATGATIAAGAQLTVQFTLTVSASATNGQTNFNVNIQG